MPLGLYQGETKFMRSHTQKKKSELLTVYDSHYLKLKVDLEGKKSRTKKQKSEGQNSW